MKYVLRFLQIASVGLVLAAAIIGFRVAASETAGQILDAVNRRGMDIFGHDLKALLQSLVDDGKTNAWAAVLAAVSSLCQGIALVLDWRNSP